MRLSRCVIIGVVAGVVTALGAQSYASEATQQAWAVRMQKMLASFTKLAPLVYSQKAFLDPKNESKIAAEIREFGKLAHTVNRTAYVGNDGLDPSLGDISSRLSDDTNEALKAFQANNKEYARYKLRRLAKSCFQCHSRNPEGPELANLDLPGIDELKPSEQADLLVATRQFERSLAVLNSIFDNPNFANKEPVEFQRAVRNALAILVRVKSDPDKAEALVDRVIAFAPTPEYLRDDARNWRKDILAWKAEVNSAKAKNANGYQRAVQLIGQAQEAQKYPLDNSSDILYFRASALLHEFLRTSKDQKKNAEAMFHLGHCYEVLNDIGQWFLQETYFETCIRRAPGTKIARRCFQRYEMNLVLGNSGSAGVFLSEPERERLQELKKIALGSNAGDVKTSE